MKKHAKFCIATLVAIMLVPLATQVAIGEESTEAQAATPAASETSNADGSSNADITPTPNEPDLADAPASSEPEPADESSAEETATDSTSTDEAAQLEPVADEDGKSAVTEASGHLTPVEKVEVSDLIDDFVDSDEFGLALDSRLRTMVPEIVKEVAPGIVNPLVTKQVEETVPGVVAQYFNEHHRKSYSRDAAAKMVIELEKRGVLPQVASTGTPAKKASTTAATAPAAPRSSTAATVNSSMTYCRCTGHGGHHYVAMPAGGFPDCPHCDSSYDSCFQRGPRQVIRHNHGNVATTSAPAPSQHVCNGTEKCRKSQRKVMHRNYAAGGRMFSH